MWGTPKCEAMIRYGPPAEGSGHHLWSSGLVASAITGDLTALLSHISSRYGAPRVRCGPPAVCTVRNLYTGVMTGYVYGADGTRVSVGTITTWGSCDPSVNGYRAMKDSIAGPTGGQLTETGVDANGNVVWEHTNVWVGGNLMATYDANGIHFELNDWNGSRRVQTDYQGVVEQTCTNLPYGNGTTCSGDPSEFLFAGLQQEDNPGLESAMYRQYASYMGRWTVPDPYNGSYNWANPQSLNRYGYVGGNPLAMTDSSGLDWGGWFYGGTVTNADLYGSTVGSWLNDLAPIVPFLNAADFVYNVAGLFDDLFKSFGWIGSSSPFHGNIAASQSGKNVPSMGGAANMLAFFQEAEPDVEPEGEGGREPEDWERLPESEWPLSPVNPMETASGCWGCNEDLPALPPKHAANFKWYIPFKLETPDTYYRQWGGRSGLTGYDGTYYSFFSPGGPIDFMREQMAILPEWGNTMENLDAVTIPAGTTVYIGPAAQQGVYPGNGIQVYVPNQ